MIMQAAWAIAIASTLTEVLLVHAIPPLRKLYNAGNVGVVANFIVSMGLSAVMGMIVQAGGTIVLIGTALSTVLSMVWFKFEDLLIKRTGKTNPLKALHVERSVINNWWEENGEVFRDLYKLIMWSLRAITYPIRKYRSVKQSINNLKTRFT